MTLTQRAAAVFDTRWPEDTALYLPDEVSEISLPDFASSLSIRTYLQMCKLRYRTERKSNAEFISPTGKVPVFKQDDLILTDFDDLVSYVQLKGLGLDADLDERSTAEMHAHIALVQSVLGNAEMYMAWSDPLIANQVTKPRAGSVYPWPLNLVVPYLKQRQMVKVVSALKWNHLSESQVCEKVKQACEALSVKLGSKNFFFGDKATALDALVFGHLFAIVTTILPNNCLSNVIKDFDNLQQLLRRVNELYFANEKVASPQIPAKR